MKKKSKKSGKKHTFQLLILLILGTVLITLLVNQYIRSLLENKIDSSTIEYSELQNNEELQDIEITPQQDPSSSTQQDSTDTTAAGEEVLPAEPLASETEDARETEASTDGEDKETVEISLYFVQVTGENTFVPVKHTRTIPHTLSVLRNSIVQLLQGTTAAESEAGAQSFIPSGTVLHDIYIKESTVYADFSETFQFNEYGSVGSLAQLYQIVYTCTEFPGLDRLQILINGEVIPYLFGDEGFIEIDTPLTREKLQLYYSASSGAY